MASSSSHPVGDKDVIMVMNGPGDKTTKIIAAQTVTTALPLIAVVLRFAARRVSKTKLSWDDWLILPALAGALLWYAMMWWALHWGFGKYIGEVTYAKLRVNFTTIWVTSICYAVSIGFAKLSILALYLRAFSPERWARFYIRALGVVTILWTIAVILCTLLQCGPVDHFWNRGKPGECNLDVKKFYLSTGIVDIATDILMMALPMYLCTRLKLGIWNKLLLCTIFLSGSFVTIVSTIRINTILHLDLHSREALNITWNFPDLAIMSSADVNMAVVCACLPTLRPLIALIIPQSWVPKSLRKRSSRYPPNSPAVDRPSRPMLRNARSGSSQWRGLLDKKMHEDCNVTIREIDTFSDTFSDGRRDSEFSKDLEMGIQAPSPVFADPGRKPSLAPSWSADIFSVMSDSRWAASRQPSAMDAGITVEREIRLKWNDKSDA